MISIITLATSDMTAILGYAGSLVSDLMPLLVVIIGIGIGMWIISYFIKRGGD